MCTHLDTHLEAVSVFMVLFVFLRQASSEISVMLINQHSTAKKLRLRLYLYIPHTHTHISLLAHTHFCCFVFGDFSLAAFCFAFLCIVISLPAVHYSYSREPTTLHTSLCWRARDQFISTLFFLSSSCSLPQLTLSFFYPLSICVSDSYGVHLSAVFHPCCDLSLVVLPLADWLGNRLLVTFPETTAFLYFSWTCWKSLLWLN